MKQRYFVLLSLFIAGLYGCSSQDKSGGYYSNDGPPTDEMVAKAIEPTPIDNEPLSKTGNAPYKVFGKNYYPRKSIEAGYSESGVASWYGTKFHGKRTSSGERYDMMAFTAAHKTLPLPSYVRVTSLENDRSVIVRVNDRGPFLKGRIIDLSYVAAKKIGIADNGTGRVRIEVVKNLDQPDIRMQAQPIAEAAPLTISDQSLEIKPLTEDVALESSEPNLMPESAAILESDDSGISGDVNVDEPAIILERKTAQLGNNTENQLPTTMNNEDEFVLPSMPESITGDGSILQTGPVVDINSIIKNSDYFIQIGAFSNKENAYKLRQEYMDKGYTSRILATDDIYRVQIGPYANADEATITMGLLQASGVTDAKLIKPIE